MSRFKQYSVFAMLSAMLFGGGVSAPKGYKQRRIVPSFKKQSSLMREFHRPSHGANQRQKRKRWRQSDALRKKYSRRAA